jgi:hypothetical protein
MSRVTIELGGETEAKLRARADALGIPIEEYLSEVLVSAEKGLPPTSFISQFGSFPELDLPTRRESWSKEEK